MVIDDEKLVNAIRILSIDSVTNAKSGHPGMPLGSSQIIFTIFKYHLRFDPQDPWWFFRDRFVLSSGHASAMLYSTLHLFGYDITMDDLKEFRKIGSKTCGHPEYGVSGVEATTGPLGQGISMAVGMAYAFKRLGEIFNKKDISLIDNYIYVIMGDGDVMEGVCYEAASLCGHLKLDNLIAIYDSNNTTIEGKTDIAFSEDVKLRFLSQGWNVIEVEDGFDTAKLNKAITISKETKGKPSLIIAKTKIGYKSPKEGSNKVHGEPLTEEEVSATRRNLGWEYEERFYIPEDIRKEFRKIIDQKLFIKKDIEKKIDDYMKKYPDDYKKFMRFINNDFEFDLSFTETRALATRDSSGIILNAISDYVENLISGSADLSPSTKTEIKKYPDRNIHFGIREHAMGAFLNGVALTKSFRIAGSTFLVFSDYLRPSIRLSAMMKINPVFIFTHDSIGVGEDGPTHQPIEHLMSLRLIPDLYVIRPCDFYETLAAWKFILSLKTSPCCLILTRQKVNTLYEYKDIILKNFSKGAYNIIDYDKPDLILIATGSEVHLAIEVSRKLLEDGIKANVVSMPSIELFKKNPGDYISKLLPSGIKKFVIEAGVTLGYKSIIEDVDYVFGVDCFGYSGAYEDVYKKFGLYKENIIKKIKEIL